MFHRYYPKQCIYRNIRLKTPTEFSLVFLFNIPQIDVAMAHDIADEAATATCNISTQIRLFLTNVTI